MVQIREYNADTGHVETLYSTPEGTPNTPEIVNMVEQYADLMVRSDTHHCIYVTEV